MSCLPYRARALVLALLFALAAPVAAGVPFWGAPASSPANTPPASLKPGEWVWQPQVAPAGPIVVVVALDEQRTYVYRNGLLVGYASSSTGKPGHGTPTGVFHTLQKDANHRSSTYNNAPMPYQQRLTWDGVALHAGGLPGYPSSHGCVHLPSAFAKVLFDASPMGMTVVVANDATAPRRVAHPLPMASVDAASGDALPDARLTAEEAYRFEPEKSPEGPVSMVISRADQRIVVFRNGVEIGRARVTLMDDQPLGTHAYVMHGTPAQPEWMAVPVPGHEAEAGQVLDSAAIARVRFPRAFLGHMREVLAPGATVVVTDGAILPHTTGTPMTVVANGAAQDD